MAILNNEIRTLSVEELDAATGALAGEEVVAAIVIGLVVNAMSNVHGISDAIDYIKAHH